MDYKMSNFQAYRDNEKIAGRDPWYQVLWYRILVLLVDVISIAFIFAIQMTIIFYKFMKVLLMLMREPDRQVVLTSYITLGMMIFATLTFAWTYFAARKYAAPMAEALSHRISGCREDHEDHKENVAVNGSTEDAK